MKQKAFTLIELLVVVAIIGILAAVGVVAYNGYTNAAKKAVVKSISKSQKIVNGNENALVVNINCNGENKQFSILLISHS